MDGRVVLGATMLRQAMGRRKKNLEELFSKWWEVQIRAFRLTAGPRALSQMHLEKNMSVGSVSLQCHQMLPSVWHHSH